MYRFLPPNARYPLSDSDPLLRRYSYHVGVSVLGDAQGSYRMVETPSEDELTAARRVFLGGHVYLVSDLEADALRASGFGDGLVFLG